MTILTNVDKGARLLDEDLLWLSTDGNPYYSEKLKQTHHLREATFHADEYRRTGDPWKVINASGHFRKAEAPDEALMLISNVPENSLKDAKARSAMFTTHGGVMRDLNRHDEGMELGLQAHALQPENFRPCTLLGALHMEMGDYDKAQDWYSKAEARGASKRGIDNELKAIFLRANALKREEIRKHLLARDPERHSWINQQKAPKRKRKP